jgi:hypothetical protein
MTFATAALAPAYNPGSWRTFFTLTGTAAATLTGLFFVAFSLRVRELQLSRVLRTRTRYLLIWLIAIAIGSGFVVMPGQSLAVLGTEILVVSAGCVAYTAWPVLRTVRSERPALSSGLAVRWLGLVATWLLSIGAGISLLVGSGGGLYLLAFGMLLGIALLVAAAWTLVVETGKHTRGQDVMPGREHPAELPGAGRLAAGEDGSGGVPGQ